MKSIKLGDMVKDTVTGYKGTVVATSDYIHGCRRLCIQAKAKKDGTFVDGIWFDEPRLVYTGKLKIKITSDKSNNGGPDRLSSSSRPNPR